ncbi:unnamed protein product [Oncorhynchus mykiss]|uniref:Uncharacterized protein n=1 Tax=Oncorhynchus mykiss TaxID=8022 RepID=A0A060X2U3_ONCMY|nr:unnamed protein product [Oncorhynchus mykiss]
MFYIHSVASLLGLPYKAGRQALRHSVTIQLNDRMGKTSDLRDFECGMIVGTRRAGSSISETAGLLGFSGSTNKTHPVISSPVGKNS